MSANRWVSLGAVLGFFSVAFGAFGAHALKDVLNEKSIVIYQTAVHYQMVHSLALVLFGIWAGLHPGGARSWLGGLFVAGTLLFSGSLYGLALTGIRHLGWITPVGGVGLLAGWILFAFLSWRA